MVWACPLCNKKYKTESGFKKHRCIYMERLESLKQPVLDMWLVFMKVYKCKIPSSKEDMIKKFIKDGALYNTFTSLNSWFTDIRIPDIYKFFEFTKQYNIPVKDWKKEAVYYNYIVDFINSENEILAIKRSEDYLIANNLVLEKISSNRLYLMLKFGNISKKYLQHKQYNVRAVLDNGQLKDLVGLV